ncbi:hypothetical protein ACH4OQ_19940 [Streptomyces luteogriseus]|uniref:hypothetical protein n=1 Tax=Streptomyces luteogriseus TaxID=68233 RepID=UPI0037AFDB62
MDHVSDHVLRTLRYIDLVAGQGQKLSPAEIDAYAQSTPPRDARRSDPLGMATLRSLLGDGEIIRDPEPVANYLLKVCWIEPVDGGIRLTKIGKAMLSASGQQVADHEASDPEVADVALDPQDPLVYVQLTRRLQRAGAGLLVDAYFKAESLVWLIESTTLRRVLISSRHPKSERDRQRIAVARATVPNGSDVEVRHTDNPGLHDRCVVSETGSVQLLGSSVTGVGKHLTAVITPADDIAQVYRQKYEALWKDAEIVTPQPVQAQS